MGDLYDVVLAAVRQGKCLNSMEVCRVVNGFASDDFRACYPRGDFKFATRPERCEYKARGCRVWSLKVYSTLRQLEKAGKVKSEKCRFYDGGNNISFGGTDVMRFWFTRRAAFETRVVRRMQQLAQQSRTG